MFKTCSILLKTQIPLLINSILQTNKPNQHIVNNSFSAAFILSHEYSTFRKPGIEKTKEENDEMKDQNDRIFQIKQFLVNCRCK